MGGTVYDGKGSIRILSERIHDACKVQHHTKHTQINVKRSCMRGPERRFKSLCRGRVRPTIKAALAFLYKRWTLEHGRGQCLTLYIMSQKTNNLITCDHLSCASKRGHFFRGLDLFILFIPIRFDRDPNRTRTGPGWDA